jgi:hypothetical protein
MNEPRIRITRSTPYARAAKRIQAAMKRYGAVSPTLEGERGWWAVTGYFLPGQATEFQSWYATFDHEKYRG